MKTRIKKLSVLAILFITLSACHKSIKPSGSLTNQVHNLGGYEKVIISDAINAKISFTSGAEQVTVQANSNLHPYIITEVIGENLYIRLKDNILIKGSYTINVQIDANDFSALEVSGASNCTIENSWINSFININASGASRISGSISSDYCNVNLSGASILSILGNALDVNMSLSGSSNFDGFSFQSDNLHADLSGASNVELTVDSTLNLNLSGGSTLRYMGEGVIENIQSSGGSSVIHL